MKKRKFVFFFIYLISLVIISGCNKPPEKDISDAVSKSEEYFKKSKGIDCVGAFDGETVKFRLLLEEQPTVEEATKLINEVLKDIEKNLKNTNTWDYYNAKLDLAYKDTIIFEGTKESGKKLMVKFK
ncbi:hypothetical protein [Fictibacillus sp. BK138]|uniref:hypothetical protein n=1 Tax=Fictibacillus sp. BK138 TaxID=2512121 RepID=UPI001028D18F|nr:hypothetical protein [Fictibacillus sp. BK138]